MQSLSVEDQSLIDQIKHKVKAIAEHLTPDPCACQVLYPPASLEEIQQAQALLGAPLPPLIREIFLQIGNGGFGPGQGITGLLTGNTVYDRNLVENALTTVTEIKAHLRDSITLADSRYTERDKLHLEHWLRLGQEQLIWYCDHGCNITTLVDYHNPDLPVYTADSLDVSADPAGTLRAWWRQWLEGSASIG